MGGNIRGRFDVQMNEEYLSDFLTHHTYTSFSGIAQLVIGFLGFFAMIFFFFFQHDLQNGLIFLVLDVLIFFYVPYQNTKKAKKQAQNDAFKKPLHYTISEEGLTVEQDGESQTVKWRNIQKLTSTRKSYLVYLGKLNAIVLPFGELGDKRGKAIELLKEYVPAGRIKIK